MARSVVATLAAIASAIAVTACAGPGGTATTGGEPRAADPPAEVATSAAAAAPPVRRSGPPIAVGDVESQGTTLHVEITGLERRGRLVTLSWTITNTGSDEWGMSSWMGETAGGLGLTVAGVSLVDPRNAKRYRVARTGEPDDLTCVCSGYDVTTYPGEKVPLYATFTAPPPEVTSIDVEFPILGVYGDVPIS
jgi:hypothetical protein